MLKKCIECGGQAEMISVMMRGGRRYQSRCKVCKKSGPAYTTKAESEYFWNYNNGGVK